MQTFDLQCVCGQARLAFTGRHIISVECCCTSCRTATRYLEQLPGGRPILTGYGATPYVLYRKDRVRVASGMEKLKAYKLSSESPTQRVVASCCNTPVFLNFRPGHWLSVYGALWPDGTRPALQVRAMTRDVENGIVLPHDVPNPKGHALRFFGKLVGAFVAMGFRKPSIDVAEETLVV
jgi:hypothetical protein